MEAAIVTGMLAQRFRFRLVLWANRRDGTAGYPAAPARNPHDSARTRSVQSLCDCSLVNEFSLAAISPRIVGQAKANAIGNRRVVVVQEDVQPARRGIGQVHLAEDLERLRRHLS